MEIYRTFDEMFGGESITRRLRVAMDRWANLPVFTNCTDEAVAEKLVVVTLWHTFVFGRFVLPSFIGHSFLSLRNLLPADDTIGKALRGVMSVGIGELATNNVFERAGETHSHYWDMREAYEQSIGRGNVLNLFESMASRNGVHSAAKHFPDYWSPNMRHYARLAERVTEKPLPTFILAAASEEVIRRGYEVILAHLPQTEQFGLFRLFLERHVELDSGDHGPATAEWFRTYVGYCPPSDAEIENAVDEVTELIEARIASYDF